jgi:hypothetical protein
MKTFLFNLTLILVLMRGFNVIGSPWLVLFIPLIGYYLGRGLWSAVLFLFYIRSVQAANEYKAQLEKVKQVLIKQASTKQAEKPPDKINHERFKRQWLN